MTLFNFGKKKEATVNPACVCNGAYANQEDIQISNACCKDASNGICCIKVLGSGCKNCHALFENTKKAVQARNLSIEVVYITDMQEIMKYGVMSMPALVVNENVISMGKVLKPAEIEQLLDEIVKEGSDSHE